MAAEETSSSSAEPRSKKLSPAKEFAFRRLARRAHSRGELARKMARAGYDEESVEDVLSYLTERRYLDDARFAREFARGRAERSRWGPARIENRLKELGVSERHIDDALADVFPDGERSSAREALRRFRAREARRRATAESRKARAYRHLLYKGFSPEVAYEVIAEDDFEEAPEVESH